MEPILTPSNEETQENMVPLEGEKHKSMVPWIILFCVIALNGLLMFALLGAAIYRINLEKQKESEESAVVSVNEHEGEVLYEDNDFGETWLTDYKTVKKSTFDDNLLQTKDGWKVYQKDGVKAAKGIDVSEHQGDIDWQTVAKSGVDFVMVRAGWRGYATGQLHKDECFEANMKGAIAAGIPVGVYFFSQAASASEAKEEADFVLDLVKGYSLTYPIAYDWERINEEDSRAKDISSEELTKCAVSFCKEVKNAGYFPMIYFYKYLAYYRYDLSQLDDVGYWLSRPGDTPGFYYEFTMWQYSIDTKIEGITGVVDCNLCYPPYNNQ